MFNLNDIYSREEVPDKPLKNAVKTLTTFLRYKLQIFTVKCIGLAVFVKFPVFCNSFSFKDVVLTTAELDGWSEPNDGAHRRLARPFIAGDHQCPRPKARTQADDYEAAEAREVG